MIKVFLMLVFFIFVFNATTSLEMASISLTSFQGSGNQAQLGQLLFEGIKVVFFSLLSIASLIILCYTEITSVLETLIIQNLKEKKEPLFNAE